MADNASAVGPKSTYEAYKAEGDMLFKQQEFTKALDSYNQALDLRQDDRNCLVARSRCYLQMGDTKNALKDAETSMSEDPTFFKGLLCKADALYFKGDFEMALVFYHRGNRLRPEQHEFRLGIQKCQEAIDNSVGTPDRVKLTKEGDLSYFYKPQEEEAAAKKKQQLMRPGRMQAEEHKRKVRPISGRKDKTIKQLLGSLYADREFLEQLLKEEADRLVVLGTCAKCKYQLYLCTCAVVRDDHTGQLAMEGDETFKIYSEKFRNKKIVLVPEDNKPKKKSSYDDDEDEDPKRAGPKPLDAKEKKTKTSEAIQNLALNGLLYLDTRTDFWRQQKPMYARKRDKEMEQSNLAKKKQSDPVKFTLMKLREIDDAHTRGKYKDVIKETQKTHRLLGSWTEEDLSNKQEVQASLHSSAGNAYLELGQYDEALEEHQKDLTISQRLRNEEMESRAMDNLGRVYARVGRFQDAIHIWEKKIDSKSDLQDLECAWIYHELGRCYLETNNTDKAVSYGEKSFEFAQKCEDEVWQLNSSVLIAQSLAKAGDDVAAVDCFERALEFAKLQGDRDAEKAIQRALKEVNHNIAQGLSTRKDETDKGSEEAERHDDYPEDYDAEDVSTPNTNSSVSIHTRTPTGLEDSGTPSPTSPLTNVYENRISGINSLNGGRNTAKTPSPKGLSSPKHTPSLTGNLYKTPTPPARNKRSPDSSLSKSHSKDSVIPIRNYAIGRRSNATSKASVGSRSSAHTPPGFPGDHAKIMTSLKHGSQTSVKSTESRFSVKSAESAGTVSVPSKVVQTPSHTSGSTASLHSNVTTPGRDPLNQYAPSQDVDSVLSNKTDKISIESTGAEIERTFVTADSEAIEEDPTEKGMAKKAGPGSDKNATDTLVKTAMENFEEAEVNEIRAVASELGSESAEIATVNLLKTSEVSTINDGKDAEYEITVEEYRSNPKSEPIVDDSQSTKIILPRVSRNVFPMNDMTNIAHTADLVTTETDNKEDSLGSKMNAHDNPIHSDDTSFEDQSDGIKLAKNSESHTIRSEPVHSLKDFSLINEVGATEERNDSPTGELAAEVSKNQHATNEITAIVNSEGSPTSEDTATVNKDDSPMDKIAAKVGTNEHTTNEIIAIVSTEGSPTNELRATVSKDDSLTDEIEAEKGTNQHATDVIAAIVNREGSPTNKLRATVSKDDSLTVEIAAEVGSNQHARNAITAIVDSEGSPTNEMTATVNKDDSSTNEGSGSDDPIKDEDTPVKKQTLATVVKPLDGEVNKQDEGENDMKGSDATAEGTDKEDAGSVKTDDGS